MGVGLKKQRGKNNTEATYKSQSLEFSKPVEGAGGEVRSNN